MSHAETEMVLQLLGIDLGKLYMLLNRFEKQGCQIEGFILPMPEIYLLGRRVSFASIKAPTCEIHTETSKQDDHK